MRHFKAAAKRSFFEVLYSTASSQAAVMVLKPGQSSSEQPENEHPRSEQWVYVISGTGRAIVEGRRQALKDGSLLLVEKGEAHQVTNTGRRPMVTVNVYAPPAYTDAGDLRPAQRVAGAASMVTRGARAALKKVSR